MADKAYDTNDVLKVIDLHGAQPVILSKSNCLAAEQGGVGQNAQSKRHVQRRQVETFPLPGVHSPRTDNLLLNEAESREMAAADQESSVRCTMEPFQRELQQMRTFSETIAQKYVPKSND